MKSTEQGDMLYAIGCAMLISGAVLLFFCIMFFSAVGVPAWFMSVYRVAAYGSLPLQAAGLLLIVIGGKMRR